eukprot:TRINITY_DN68020_c1_g5_i1.p1 TRINITY_DN68020_c1_g5~~TRINITY_DN68020_c1_g5_i1.p1  ORF type:complete len:793 (-),score=152.64 TRINITY_DN68020_c1_g5_i1:247-2625(-)
MAAVYQPHPPAHAKPTTMNYWTTSTEQQPEDILLVLWTLQRDEVSARLSIENQEMRERKEVQAILSREWDSARRYGDNKAAQYSSSQRYQYPQQLSTDRPDKSHSGALVAANRTTPTLAQIHNLRSRINALSETKQVLLSEYVRARCPQCITTDVGGLATIDPHQLDLDACNAITTHLDLIDDDNASSSKPAPLALPAPPTSQPPVTTRAVPSYPYPADLITTTAAYSSTSTKADEVWRTGYVGETNRGPGPRPHGTVAQHHPHPPPAAAGGGMMDPTATYPPPSAMQVAVVEREQFARTMNDPSRNHWLYEEPTAYIPDVGPTHVIPRPPMRPQPPPGGPAAAGGSSAWRKQNYEAAPQMAAPEPMDEAADRRDLARKILMLSPARQRAVAQEVRVFAPQAIKTGGPGILEIDTATLDRRTVGRLKRLIHGYGMADEELSGLTPARAFERDVFMARERARERERLVDLEREKQAREDSVKQELERDLQLVRSEVEEERRRRWWDGDAHAKAMLDRDQLYSEIMNNREREMKLLMLEQARAEGLPLPGDDQDFEMRCKLQQALQGLTAADLLRFADYCLVLQPDVIHDNAINPIMFSKSNLPLATNYALQLKARHQPVYTLVEGGNNNGTSNKVYQYTNANNNNNHPAAAATRTQQTPPPAIADNPRNQQQQHQQQYQQQPAAQQGGTSLPPIQKQQQKDDGPLYKLNEDETKERVAVARKILRDMSPQKQGAVCEWLKENSPSAIKRDPQNANKTIIETANMSPQEFYKLKQFIAQQDQQLPALQSPGTAV